MMCARSLHVVGGFAGLVFGCTYPIPEHCMNNNGSVTCMERGAGAYCNICVLERDGCTDEMPYGDCLWAGDPATSTDLSVGTHGTTDAHDEGVDTTLGPVDSTSATGLEHCVTHDDCVDALSPYCGLEGVCVACDATPDGDVACKTLDPERPLCINGRCGQCDPGNPVACGGAMPFCSASDLVCSADCTSHVQCGESGCNLYTGQCLPSNAVVHVGIGRDFASIASAVNSFGPGQAGTIIVHEAINNGSITISDGQMLAILVEGGGLVTWQGMAGTPQLSVYHGTVFLDGYQLSGNEHDLPALRLEGTQARLWAERVRVVDNSDSGILVKSGADLVLRNCFVGSDVDYTTAVEVASASAKISYSTLIGGAFGDVLLCSGSYDVAVDDSVLVKYGNLPVPIECTQGTFHNSAAEMDLPGSGNTNVGPFDVESNWFTDVTKGDFTLTPSGADVFGGTAEWNVGDPVDDILGTPRPVVEGSPDYAGAHIP